MDFAAKAAGLVALERRYMPDWDGFDYPQFLEEENDYKREAAAFAQEQLAEATLRGLIDAQDWDEIIGRLEKVGQQNSFLFLSTPKKGDLGVLYVEGMDKAAYCQQALDLLYGPDASEARLDRYVAFCGEHDLPCKWTFPTLLLFYLFPESEFFVKPTAADWFLRYMGSEVKRRAVPNGAVYAEIVRLARGVFDELGEYGPSDLMDVQGLVWTAFRNERGFDDTPTVREEAAEFVAVPDEEGYFSRRTFELLQLLHDTPTYEFYDANRDEFDEHLLGPVRDLMQKVAAQLPSAMRDELETDKNILSHIPKNDFGKGGVYDYVWAAFYPKGQTRTTASQLSITVDKDVLVMGWYVADKAPKYADRFIRNTNQNADLSTMLAGILDDAELLFGATQRPNPKGTSLTGQQWLFAAASSRLRVEREISVEEVLGYSKQNLGAEIVRRFRQLYPLVILAASDDPVPEIRAYLLSEGLTLRPPKVWWVNMGQTLDAASDLGCLWAPLRTKNNRTLYHWETMSELLPGDVVLHYADQAVRCVSRVSAPGEKATCPEELADAYGKAEGRKVTVDFHWLDQSVHLRDLRDLPPLIAIQQGPLTFAGSAKQGYLFRFTPDGLRQCVQAAPDAGWPDYVREMVGEIIVDHIKPIVPLKHISDATGFSLETLQRWVRAIERKRQAVLYGPPGTGKTFIAEHLARHLIGGGRGFSDLVQFHPAYAYEDFIQGLRPEANEGQLSYDMVPGRFLEFVHKAGRLGPDDTCVLIIDEINRANLSRVLGELMYLLEYRDKEIPLSGGDTLRIPPNVRIIGTMNTADRSIALVDHALRRRFAFLKLAPEYELLTRYHERVGTGFDTTALIQVLQKVNREIGDPNYAVGITFFMRPDIQAQIADIWQMEIEPYLEEFFFGSGMPDDLRWSKVESTICSSAR